MAALTFNFFVCLFASYFLEWCDEPTSVDIHGKGKLYSSCVPRQRNMANFCRHKLVSQLYMYSVNKRNGRRMEKTEEQTAKEE